MINDIYTIDSNEKKLVAEFTTELKTYLEDSFINPVDFLFLERVNLSFNREDIQKGYLNNYDDFAYVFSDEKLFKYYPEDIVFLNFDFERTGQWFKANKIKKSYLYIYNSATRTMCKLAAENGLFTNLSKKTVEMLSDAVQLNPICNWDSLLTKTLTDISIDIANIPFENEYGSIFLFDSSIKEINLYKNRLNNFEAHIIDFNHHDFIEKLRSKLTEKIVLIYESYIENQDDNTEAISKYSELLKIFGSELQKSQVEYINDKLAEKINLDDFSYFPLKVGHNWKFVNPSKEIFQEILVENNNQDEYKLVSKFYISNLAPVITYEILEYHGNMLLINASGGGLFNSSLKYYDEKPIKLKIPLALNQTWHYEVNGIKHEIKVLKKHHSVTIPSGIFDDVIELQEKIIDGSSTFFKFDFYAKNIGLIKTEGASAEDGVREIFIYLE